MRVTRVASSFKIRGAGERGRPCRPCSVMNGLSLAVSVQLEDQTVQLEQVKRELEAKSGELAQLQESLSQSKQVRVPRKVLCGPILPASSALLKPQIRTQLVGRAPISHRATRESASDAEMALKP